MALQVILTQDAATRRTRDERALAAVEAAELLKRQGCYDEARLEMAAYWSDIGSPPRLDGLSPYALSQVLLMAGVLTGFIGSERRTKGSQRLARDLIRPALRMFIAQRKPDLVAEATHQLAYTFYREGKYEAARAILAKAEQVEGVTDPDVLAQIKVRQALVEQHTEHFELAYNILSTSAHLFDAARLKNGSTVGSYHNTLAGVLQMLAATQGLNDYSDRAFIEFHAAHFFFSEAGHTKYEAAALNNLGYILFTKGKYGEAHDYLDRARALYVALGDVARTAQVDETRARVFAAQGEVGTALKIINAAVAVLRASEEASTLALVEAERRRIIEQATAAGVTAESAPHIYPALPLPGKAATARELLFHITLEETDDSLAAYRINPGSDVKFFYASEAEDGQLVACFHMRQQAWHVGFYERRPSCDAEGCTECEGEIVVLSYGEGYEPDVFEAHELTVIGVHPFLRRPVLSG